MTCGKGKGWVAASMLPPFVVFTLLLLPVRRRSVSCLLSRDKEPLDR